MEVWLTQKGPWENNNILINQYLFLETLGDQTWSAKT